MPKYILRVIPAGGTEPGMCILLSAFFLLSVIQVDEATAEEGKRRRRGRNKNKWASGDFVTPPVL